jgi:hypothetical protein
MVGGGGGEQREWLEGPTGTKYLLRESELKVLPGAAAGGKRAD